MRCKGEEPRISEIGVKSAPPKKLRAPLKYVFNLRPWLFFPHSYFVFVPMPLLHVTDGE